jgi:hypothetical protein
MSIMQRFPIILFLEQPTVASRSVDRWLHTTSCSTLLEAIDNHYISLVSYEDQLDIEGDDTTKVIHFLLKLLDEYPQGYPVIVIKPTTFLTTCLDTVLYSIANTIIPNHERSWLYKVKVSTLTTKDTSTLYLLYSNPSSMMVKEVTLTIPCLASNLTVFHSCRPDEPHLRQVANNNFCYTRIHVQGSLLETHRHLAWLSPTENLMVIDGDNVIVDKPRLPLEKWNKTYLYYARNPYNGLVYGHGGIKVFRRQDIMAVNELGDNEDLLMTVAAKSKNGLTVIPQVCSEHRYATTPRAGAITALREGYKLRMLADKDREADSRLFVWCDSNRYESQYEYMALAARKGASLVGTNHLNNDWYYLNTLVNDNGTLKDGNN